MSNTVLTKHALPVALLLSALAHLAMFSWPRDSVFNAGQQAEHSSVRVQIELLTQQLLPVQQSAHASIDKPEQDIVDVDSSHVTSQKTSVTESLPGTQTPVKPFERVEEIATQVANDQQHSSVRTIDKDSDPLLKLIYVEINKHKHYPFMAIKRRREGLVTLNFVMHPDGQVTDIAIVESSRYAVLDNAARRAIQAISPFQLASKYLSMQQNYNVGLDFRLN